MKKIFYFTHIPWNWIKQRPQFIAEELGKTCLISVVQEQVFDKKSLVDNNTNLSISNLFRLPYSRLALVRRINAFLFRCQLRLHLKNFKYIWLTSPLQYPAVRGLRTNEHILVYDCMDDHINFPLYQNNRVLLDEIKKNEGLLVKDADLVFCSSNSLKDKVINRYLVEKADKIKILNNAFNVYKSLPKQVSHNIKDAFERYPKNLCYIGTVAEWFDFDKILGVLEKHEELYCFILGPKEALIPEHPRIIYFGVVPHEDIYTIMKMAGVLIMPFKLTDLILSVNPVKVYEYIYSQSLSIIVKYPETVKFDEYVYLYESSSEFEELIDKYCMGQLTLKSDINEYQRFALANTWEARATEINSLIECLR